MKPSRISLNLLLFTGQAECSGNTLSPCECASASRRDACKEYPYAEITEKITTFTPKLSPYPEKVR